MYGNSRIPRGLINFAQILGTTIAAIGLLSTILLAGQIVDLFGSNEIAGKMSYATLVSFEVFILFKTIASGVAIYKFMKDNSDDDILNNKFVLAALSLNVGGFFTPFILSSLPNVDTRSNINPRYYLTRVLGIISLGGGISMLAALFLVTLTGAESITVSQMMDTNNSVAGVITVAFAGLMIFIGTLSASMFFTKNSNNIFEGNTFLSKIMNAVSIIFLVMATIELIWLIFIAVIRLLGAIGNMIRAITTDGNAFVKLFAMMFALFNLTITIYYVTYIMRMAVQCISGIWTKNKEVVFTKYSGLEDAKIKKQNRQY
ncbi:hypothetical protein [Mesoplasma photuris]|uniref:hypothetical protein n=1 Tax=Mesoplasma photuris TaxID=217731 RepID=UPI0004E25887|nr:hypothetical protein [Mesoplasma photuris]